MVLFVLGESKNNSKSKKFVSKLKFQAKFYMLLNLQTFNDIFCS